MAVFARADWAEQKRAFDSAKTHDEAVNLLREGDNGEDIRELVSDYDLAQNKKAKDKAYDAIGDLVATYAVSEHFTVAKDANKKVGEIKKDPLYKAQRESSGSNWLQKIFDRLKKLFNRDKQPDMPNMPTPPGWLPQVISGIFYVFCGAAIIGIIYLLVKIPWAWSKRGRSGKRKPGSMLEDGEVLLSEDEYMLEADRLIAEGKFREACRALYLASLLRIDTLRIARFDPYQTNWEHLKRIETSKTRPETLDFRPATKAFDHAWYGYRATSASDVAVFKDTYLQLKSFAEAAK
jgi:hypothetical protein